MRFARVFANPSADTFDIKPIRSLVKRYLQKAAISVDPFARNKQWATYTNDLNPETSAEYHLDAFDFLQMLFDKGIKADLVLFDPPYTRRQVAECYDQIGRKYLNEDSQYFSLNWKREREAINHILEIGGFVISFGYHSNGMQLCGAYQEEELLLVRHGGNHYDTICIVERKLAHQENMFELQVPVPSNNRSHLTAGNGAAKKHLSKTKPNPGLKALSPSGR